MPKLLKTIPIWVQWFSNISQLHSDFFFSLWVNIEWKEVQGWKLQMHCEGNFYGSDYHIEKTDQTSKLASRDYLVYILATLITVFVVFSTYSISMLSSHWENSQCRLFCHRVSNCLGSAPCLLTHFSYLCLNGYKVLWLEMHFLETLYSSEHFFYLWGKIDLHPSCLCDLPSPFS